MINKKALFSILIPLSLFNLPVRAQTPLEQVLSLAPAAEFSVPLSPATAAAPAVLPREAAMRKLRLFDYRKEDVLSV